MRAGVVSGMTSMNGAHTHEPGLTQTSTQRRQAMGLASHQVISYFHKSGRGACG
jgi:hypothetical protein